jgi:hypothetical protein
MIKAKEKKCKGLGIAFGYGCGKLTIHRINGLGKMCGCYSDWLLNSENGKIKMQKSIIKAKAVVKKIESKKSVEQKNKIRENITNWKNKLQTEVQLIARLIDKDLTCLARGKFGKMAGGHIFSKGGHSQMRFNLHNIHRQSFASNNCQNDDGLLREMLSIEYGNEYLEFIKSLRKYDVPKKTDKEYQELYYNALEVTKTLKKADKTYSLKERIELRNELNLKIGLYSETQSNFNYGK